MKKFFPVIPVLLLASRLFAVGQDEGVSGGMSGTIPLRFTTWTSDEKQLGLFKDMAEEFNASQNVYAIDLTVDSIPFGDYISKLTLQLSGSNPPDIGWLVETSAPTFINAGVLQDLTGDLKKYDYDDFARSAMNLWVKNNSVYGVPFSTSPFIVIYNKTMFNKAGVPTPMDLVVKGEWTWDNFRKISRDVKDKTGVYGFQGIDGQAYDVRVWHNLVPIIRGFGGDAWDAKGNVTINSPEAVKAVQLFHDMVYVDKSVVPPGELSDFYAGNAAMTTGQISRISKLKDVGWEWELAPLPQGPAGMNSSFTIGQAAIVAFSAGKNRDAAAAFVAFMTDKENVSKMSVYWPPARKSVMDSNEFLSGNPQISVESMVSSVVPGMKYGKVLPYHEKFPQISLSASAQFDRLWKADVNVQEVMDSVAQAIKSQM